MNSEAEVSWSQLTRWRSECHQRFGSIHDLPIIGAPHQEFWRLLRSDSCVLDIGAGVHKPLQKSIDLPAQRYFSLDIDPAGDFDFRSFEEIPRDLWFDLIWANQVLEHLTADEAFKMLSSAYQSLVDGGRLLATVPNPAHPVRHWGDATHVTAWSMNELYSLLRNAGFYIVSLARYNKHPLTRNPIKRAVVNIVCEVFRVDWCDSLMIFGEKTTSTDAN